MKNLKKWIKWKVAEAPTGRFRSFQVRGWPDANYKDGNESICASIHCPKDYYPSDVKTGNHPELTLRIAVYSQDDPNKWVWRSAKKRFKTLDEAKQGLIEILSKYPEMLPRHIRETFPDMELEKTKAETSE